MNTSNGEFRGEYRVGQMLPSHAVALREQATARLEAEYSPVARIRADQRVIEAHLNLRYRNPGDATAKVIYSLLEMEELMRVEPAYDALVARNRERIFPRI